MTRLQALAIACEVWSEQRRGRIEDYQFIGGPKISRRQAAERLGVSIRTIDRYNRELREAQHA